MSGEAYPFQVNVKDHKRSRIRNRLPLDKLSSSPSRTTPRLTCLGCDGKDAVFCRLFTDTFFTRERKVMTSHTGLVLLREPQPLYQARDQVVREQTGGRQGADGEPTGARGRQGWGGQCGEGVEQWRNWR
jgi:hypothetical protein